MLEFVKWILSDDKGKLTMKIVGVIAIILAVILVLSLILD